MRIAAWDLGSNSFHLAVAEAASDGSFVPLAKEKELLGLGAIVESNAGVIPEDDIANAIRVLQRFRKVADSCGAEEHVACATAALRRALNAEEIIRRIRNEIGINVNIISGSAEAALIFRGVQAGVLIDPGPAICFDLGGGSLEVIVGDQRSLQFAESLPVGVAALAARYLPTSSASSQDRKRLRNYYREMLLPVQEQIAPLHPVMAIGSAGTIGALTRLTLLHHEQNVPRSLNHAVLERKPFLEVAHSLVRMDREERAALPGLDARRVDTIVAGAICVETIFELFDLEEMLISDWGLREGLLIDTIAKHDLIDWSDDPGSIRNNSVQAFARRCSWPEAHSRHVSYLALEIFDATKELHELENADRELLEFAGWLHDIGEHVASDGHDRHGAYLIHYGRLRGFSPQEILILAGVTRWHRSGTPRREDPLVGTLSGSDLRRVRHLCAILRIADGLDRGRSQAVHRVDIHLTGKTLEIVLDAAHDAELELWGAHRKAELARSLWKCEISIRLGS